MLGIFLVRYCDGFEILVLGVFHKKDFGTFDFFVHITMCFNGTNSGARTKVNQRNNVC